MAGPTKKELEVILTLKNRMSTEVKRVERDMDSMGRKGKKASKETGDGFEWIRKKAAGAASAIKGMINPITLLGGALGAGALFALSKGLSEAAASAEELDSKFQAIFGDETRNMATWVDELSTSVKRGRQELREMVAGAQPFIDRLLGVGEASRDTTKALTQLAVDVASFYNLSDQDVMSRFQSALVGNTEALDAMYARISASEVETRAGLLGFGKLGAEITETEKVQARLSLLFERFPQAIGDAALTAGSFTNRMKELRGVVTDLRAEFGTRLNEAILQGLDDAGGVQKVKELTSVFFASVVEFSRVAIQTVSNLAGAAGDALDRFGGADGVIRLIQAKGDVLVAQLKVFGNAFRDGVLDLIEGISGAIDWLRSKGLISEANPALSRSLDENLARAKEIRELAREASRERQRLESTPGSGSKQIRDEEQYIERLREEAAALDPIIERQQRSVDLALELADARAQLAAAGNPWASFDQEGFRSAFAGGVGGSSGGGLLSTADAIAQAAPQPGGQAQDDLALVLQAAASTGLYAGWQDFTGKISELPAGGPGTLEPGYAALLDAQRKAKEAQDELMKQWEGLQEGFVTRQVANISDAFLGVATGAIKAKDAIKQFFQQFLADLLRAQTQNVFRGALGGLFGSTFEFVNPAPFANGGTVKGGLGAPMPVKAYASGGPIMRSPHVALMGEGRYDEAVVPLPDGKSIPVRMAGGSGGGQFSVSVNIQAVDARGVTELIAGDPEGFAGLISNAFARDYNLKGLMTGSAV